MVSKYIAVFSLLAAALTVSAAPAANIDARQSSGVVTATLIGAAGAQYTMQIPTTSTFIPTGNPLSISHIQTDGGPCGFFGIDGLLYAAPAAGYGDVGPPQTIVGVACGPIPQH